jgi:hypothetical protein
MKRIILLLLCLPCNILCIAQHKTIQSYHTHSRLCAVIGAIVLDFSIELFDDSTVAVSRYQSKYDDQYNAVTRITSFGRYSLEGDTIKISYYHQTKSTKDRSNNIIQTIEESSVPASYPSNVFMHKKRFLIPLTPFFSVTKRVQTKKLRKLENEFENWDNANADRSRIFGLSK